MSGQIILILALGILRLAHILLAAEVKYSILEKSPAGTLVGNIAESIELANLVAQSNLASMRFSFLNADSEFNDQFDLGFRTGALTVSTKLLDREDICPYDVNCVLELQVAIQSTQNQFFRKVTINVDIVDINDNAPQFKVNQTTLTISESVQVPSTFPLPSAQDKDTGRNNSLKEYEIVPKEGPFELVYSIPSSNLFLRVVKELDRESVSKYSVKIIARDGGVPPKEGVLNLDIVVDDINDNAPVFTKDIYSKVVDETLAPGSILMTLVATDYDAGKNGQVRYNLGRRQSSSVLSMFSIGDTSGELRLMGDFQTAETEVYKVDVEASDQGDPPFTTTTTVTITVKDTINSPPKLVISYLSSNDFSSVTEYANLGVAVAHILVKDTDRGPNGIVQCNLTSAGGYFELQSYDVKEYKVIVAKPLDRELTSVHNVTVECYDAGMPSLSTSKTFQVKVLDENDNAPEFPDKVLQVRVKENNPVGLLFAKPMAVDKDDPDTPNGRVGYRLADINEMEFIIDATSGAIKALISFDFEKSRSVNFTVIAEDNGIPRRSAKLEVLVNIIDENDNAPRFAQSRFSISMSEYADVGTIIGDLSASDLDSGMNGQLETSLVPGSGRSRRSDSNGFNQKDSAAAGGYQGVDDSNLPFLLQPNGTLSLKEIVDHELTSSFEFEVEVQDRGSPPLSTTATVVIDVRDENDNAPQVLHPNVSEIVFTALTGSDTPETLMTFEVVDKDSGENGRIVFTVTARNDSGRFDVDQRTGDVIRTRGLNANDAGTYKLSVMIKDSGNPPLYDVRTLLIHVQGGNGTAASRSGNGDQYIVIALTLVCVTVLLSVTILLVIVIMRRLDRRRKASRHMEPSGAMQFHNSRVVTAFVDPIKMDNFHGESEDHDLREDVDGKGEKKKINDSRFGFSPSSGSINKASDVISSQVIQENNLNLPTSNMSDVDLLQTFHNSKSCGVVPEDGASDSSGETITSDSGRGGSDEDISASNNLSGNLDDSRGGHNGSFQSNLSTFCNSASLKSSVKDPVRGSSRKHVTFKDMERFRNSIKCQPDSGESATSPMTQEGGTSQGLVFNPVRPQQVPMREMNIPVSREKSSNDRLAAQPNYGSFSGNPVSKYNTRSLTSSAYNESLGRDSPRLLTFSTSEPPQQSFQNLCNPRLPMYCTEDNIPSPMPTEAQRDWKTYPVTGCPEPSIGSMAYTQMTSPIDKLFHSQHRTSSPYTVQNMADQRPAHPKETSWSELLNNMNTSKDKLFQRAPSNASLNPDPRLHSPAPHIPPRRHDVQSPRRDVHASQASLTGRDVSKFQTCELPRNTSSHLAPSRDWTSDSIATTEDGDDQRSTTTTSGSYTIDNEEDYLSLDYKPKDIVV
ncbi:protocadherin-9 [Biomphalaria pfeifferi]|uniref:Protocadherin-9 n=1 Tax=Biomphalaria pfeifferi TaxID=112525 RepID=A0AAD8C274_BIOPF|nr:protocadherin-9 [Biomphalaria pfeifferi]